MGMSPRLMRPRATGFNPKSIASLSLWLDAADASSVTLNGPTVSQWSDKSGLGKHFTQSTANNQPSRSSNTIGTRSALTFDGSNDSLSCSAAIPNSRPFTFFLVQRILTISDYGMSYASGSGATNFEIRQSASTGGLQVLAANGSNINDTSSNRLGINDVISLLYPSSGIMSGYRNGTALPLAANSTNTPGLSGTHYIGQRADGYYANICVGEILAYSGLLTDTQRKTVERALGSKWGIAIA